MKALTRETEIPLMKFEFINNFHQELFNMTEDARIELLLTKGSTTSRDLVKRKDHFLRDVLRREFEYSQWPNQLIMIANMQMKGIQLFSTVKCPAQLDLIKSELSKLRDANSSRELFFISKDITNKLLHHL
jgi:hypothetical protein